jgi:hypothetical protein
MWSIRRSKPRPKAEPPLTMGKFRIREAPMLLSDHELAHGAARYQCAGRHRRSTLGGLFPGEGTI